MSRVFYTADTHFNHEFVAKTRDFGTAEEHDEHLIDTFNRLLTKRDHLWILGDLGMGSLTKVLESASRINAVKHLVFGNHDPGHPMFKGSHAKQRRYLEVFESVHVAEQHIIHGQRVLLSHFPYQGDHKDEDRHTQWRLRDEGQFLLHGHVHAERLYGHHEINVGVDWHMEPWEAREVAGHMAVMGAEL